MEKVTDHDQEVLSLAELTELAFKDLFITYEVGNAPEKRKADIIDSLWSDIYDSVFKPQPGEIVYNNCKSKLITYKVDEVEAVVKSFVKLNKRYGGVIKFNQFANLTGINRYTLYLWHKANHTNGYIFSLSKSDMEAEYNNIYIINNGNGDIEYRGNSKYIVNDKLSSMRFDVIKKLQEEMQDSNTNGLSNDTMGHALRANNEDELGKLYEPRRIVQQEAAKRVLTAGELLKLGGKHPDESRKIADNENL